MLPSFNRQGSGNFMRSSGFIRSHSDTLMEVSTPSFRPFSQSFLLEAPSRDYESTYFGYTLPSPLHVGAYDSHFALKRFGSMDSASTDTSPVVSGRVREDPVVEMRQIPRVTKLRQREAVADDVSPVLKLGDEGRAKLKAALSEQVRRNPELKARVDEIGKIRLASIQQLLMMAKVCDLWEYVEMLSLEHRLRR